MLKMNRKKVAALFMIFGILPQSVSFAEEKLDQYNLDEIVVTASQEKIKQELNTPATTEIFTAEDIKNYNGSNVQEVLEYAAGAIAAQPTGVGSTFGMRGLTGASRNPTILVDGVPLNMQGFGNLDAIPVNAVERIEIIRGTGAGYLDRCYQYCYQADSANFRKCRLRQQRQASGYLECKRR